MTQWFSNDLDVARIVRTTDAAQVNAEVDRIFRELLQARSYNGFSYTAPSTRNPFAPVTLGRLPGRPASRSRASQANAVAST